MSAKSGDEADAALAAKSIEETFLLRVFLIFLPVEARTIDNSFEECNASGYFVGGVPPCMGYLR